MDRGRPLTADMQVSELQLTVHADAVSFLEAARSFLMISPAETSIISLPAARMAESPQPEDVHAYHATVSIDGGVVAAASCLPRGGVLLTPGPDAAFTLLARDIARTHRPEGIAGPRSACMAFTDEWQRCVGEAWLPRFELRHFALRKPPRAVRSRGAMRRATVRDRRLLIDWQLAFNTEVGLPETRERLAVMVARRITRGELYVWVDGGRVAFAGFRDSQFAPIARIAPVYTPPSGRGRGYATALVSAMCGMLLRNGKDEIFLTTDLANPVSNRVYVNIGFEPAADHVHLSFDRKTR